MMELKYRIRALWRNSNSAERKLWHVLQNPQLYSEKHPKTLQVAGEHFCHQSFQLINYFIGSHFVRYVAVGDFIVDFLCDELKLVISLENGDQNLCDNQSMIKQLSDYSYHYERTLLLQYRGYLVVQIFYCDVLNNLQGVLDNLNIVMCQRKRQLITKKEQLSWI